MINNDFNHFGDDIRRTIQDAIERGDFSRLNQTITNTVNQASDWVNRNIANTKYRTYDAADYNPVNDMKKKKAKKQNVALYASKPASVPISIVLIALGSVFGLGALSLVLVALILGMAAGDTIQAVAMIAIMVFPIFLCTKAVTEGIRTLGRLKRFRIYKEILGTAEFCKIVELADAVHKTTKFVIKELGFMIGRARGKPGSCGCVSYKNNLYISFSRKIKESEFERLFFTKLVEMGIPVTIESNMGGK